MKINKILLVTALALCALSVFSYTESVRRAERFERGQKFLQNLNPDSIIEILIAKGDEATHLKREDDRFLIVDAGNYPAKNEAVNRFIRDVLDLGLEKKIGTGESLLEELELVSGGENTIEVTFKDANQQEMVHFLVGKSLDDGGGNYVLRNDGDDDTIYLTSSRAYFSTGQDDFLKKEILNVEQSQIAAIHGRGFAIEDQDGNLALANLPAGKKESSKVGQLKSLLAGLRFNKHYLADAPEVQGLYFDSSVEIDLQDESGYAVSVASRGDNHYLRIRGFHKAGQLSIAVDADEEEASAVAEQLKRQNEIQDFNAFHGSWIYEVTETTADKVKVKAPELMENA